MKGHPKQRPHNDSQMKIFQALDQQNFDIPLSPIAQVDRIGSSFIKVGVVPTVQSATQKQLKNMDKKRQTPGIQKQAAAQVSTYISSKSPH